MVLCAMRFSHIRGDDVDRSAIIQWVKFGQQLSGFRGGFLSSFGVKCNWERSGASFP